MNTKRKLSLTAFISTFVIVLLFSVSINAVYAYFSATASEQYKLKFATLTIDLKDSSNKTATSDTINDKFTWLLPGDKIDFSNVKVHNTGNTPCYVLVNVIIDIQPVDEGEAVSLNKWYNLSGTEIDSNNLTAAMGATLLNEASSAPISFTWECDGEEFDDDYQNASVSASVTAYAIQSFLPDRPQQYTTDAVYASYFICTNYEDFIENT